MSKSRLTKKRISESVNEVSYIDDVMVQSGMILRSSSGVEGPCDFYAGKLYIYPARGKSALLVNVGDNVEVISEQPNPQELERRKSAIIQRNTPWHEQRGLEATRQFDSSNESW